MAKRRVGRIEASWPQQMKGDVHFSQYLIVNQLRIYAREKDRRAVLSLISFVRVLRMSVENLPVWPRNVKFEHSEVEAWRARILENMTFARSKMPAALRDEFETSVMADLGYLSDYMNRKRDKANDI